MPWGQLGGWVGAVISLLCAVYVYGRLAEKVDNHAQRLVKFEDRLDDHGNRIAHLEVGHRRS